MHISVYAVRYILNILKTPHRTALKSTCSHCAPVEHVCWLSLCLQSVAAHVVFVFLKVCAMCLPRKLSKLAVCISVCISRQHVAVWPGVGLVPLLVRLLYPKMRKRSGRLGGKGAPGSARSAILNYLAALDSMELAPLVQLFLQPISAAFKQQQGVGVPHTTSAHRSAHAAPGWCLLCYTCWSLCCLCECPGWSPLE